MQAGQLDRRITLQRCTEAQASGGNGEPIKTWSTLATVWAKYEPSGGNEGFSDGQERVSWADAKFLLRYRTDVTPGPKDRVLFGSRYYDILAVNQTARLQTVELLCKARGEGVTP